ncbi:MAG: outer membrane lipid asymmetry maintenance protein MlaD [Gammaproteobacteria bacterium CG11_big_fil_rev_8_21_14_0_20_46_22]|nr:MAG: outer membrane lipid asymmetry maintenance protein MlaD [Gammaproteobacteria bacterium CG12_big_fil_rev_8_21_14_0_65_46_12]PIR10418.1 MAG: outer membrane lipid asymmetry maintenance protein MlaD [Gammaproteobacteria bacterium CG11_big_fil_rev_8_21_14_0_20_46_22]
MQKQRVTEMVVGIFIIIAILCFIFLAFKVSGLTSFSHANTYRVKAEFQNIGDLKVRAPVTIAGVAIGQVSHIDLDPETYQAVVTMKIAQRDQIPVDSTANIFTAGLIGSNYVSITPGFSPVFVKNGGNILRTNQAMILQDVIGQLLFSLKGGDDKADDKAKASTSTVKDGVK